MSRKKQAEPTTPARRKNYVGTHVPFNAKPVETVTPVLGFKPRKTKLRPRLQNNPVI